ncbi:MAG: hypothetical protein K2O65_08735 [Lachnospiraceae bacterium]|nr:hypothetical protein [Lachnospiraceae bacterium]
MTTEIIKAASDKKHMVTVELFGSIEKAELIDSDSLMKLNVRYIATDYEYSGGYDIYEDNLSGYLYATKL